MENNLISFYEKRLKELEHNPHDYMDYMLRAAPYIQELYTLTEEYKPDESFPMAVKTNAKEQELFRKFMLEVKKI